MPALTLHQGDAQAEFEGHPTEVARRWLMKAAEIEVGWVSETMRRFAAALPRRGPIRKDA